MAVTDFFAGEIVTELLKNLIAISKKSWQFKDIANGLKSTIDELLPIIQEIKYSGVELTPHRQFQLNALSETLRQGHELAHKVLNSSRYNIYKNLQYGRKMEKIERTVSKFIQGPLQAHILADVHHIRFETTERFDRLDNSSRRIEQRLGSLKLGATCGGGGVSWMEEAVRRVKEEKWEFTSGKSELVLGLSFGLKKVKEMVIGRDDLNVVGICGIGGAGKTTLTKELIKDDHVRSYFDEKILLLTVSQSPDIDDLKAKILGFVMGNQVLSPSSVIPQYNSFQFEWRNPTKTLVVLDDVWSLQTLQPLLFQIPGCKILVVSRFKFSSVVKATYQVELLEENEAVSLFCHSAFGETAIPFSADKKLVNQIVDECKGLPLALKVIGSSLRDQPAMMWKNASKRLSRGESISEAHENELLERMAISVKWLTPKVRECFLDLGAFPEDKKIPLDVLINMWVEIHDNVDEEQAFAILNELSDKNLVTLVTDARDNGDSSYDISVTQHDMLRDLALHLSNRGAENVRSRLVMPKREEELPREWERHSDEPFQARIVSIHTGEMTEMEWFEMRFPKAEVLILNFASNEYFLPPFIWNMPKLKALILINYGASNAVLHGCSVLSNLGNLRSLWLEKVSVPQLLNASFPCRRLRTISLILCKLGNSLDHAVFPRLLELTIDHCEDLYVLPSSICDMRLLKNLSITNCHYLWQLPPDLSKLKCLQILRLYACPSLQKLPPDICELVCLKYLNISQCCGLRELPTNIGNLSSLEKIDMRECSQIRTLPNSITALRSLGRVVCDEEISWFWNKASPDVHVQVAEKRFDLDWLDE